MNKTKLTTIYLVRHGESEANAGMPRDPLKTTKTDGSPLTNKGKAQAKELGDKLKHIHFDAVFSSNLTRAVQTAEILTLEREIAVKTNAQIRERAFGDYAKHHPGKKRDELELELQEALHTLDEKAKMSYKHIPEMETPAEGVARLITFLREIAVAYSGKTVLVVNHGNMMRSLLTHLGWASFDELPAKAVVNTGYIILESDGVDFFIKEVQGANKQSNAKRGW